jgi:hypothetical protein
MPVGPRGDSGLRIPIDRRARARSRRGACSGIGRTARSRRAPAARRRPSRRSRRGSRLRLILRPRAEWLRAARRQRFDAPRRSSANDDWRSMRCEPRSIARRRTRTRGNGRTAASAMSRHRRNGEAVCRTVRAVAAPPMDEPVVSRLPIGSNDPCRTGFHDSVCFSVSDGLQRARPRTSTRG